VLAFVAFSLCASAIYLLNDIADVQNDRLHPRKRRRPIAAGDLSIPAATLISAALLAGSAAVALVGVSWAFAALLVAYVVTTSAYSLVLKREPVADIFALTALYVLRIVAGGAATHTPLSSWLLGFALFLFLSLAFVKRYAELLTVDKLVPGRGYAPSDSQWMHAIGTSAGYMAVLVLALYLTAPDVMVLYRRPQFLWLLCPLLLYWLTRLWFRAGRRLVHDDPVVEMLKDPAAYVIAALASAAMLAAI
jgi:4-hydroxybenzoate polyprenyltransferase